MQHKLKELAIKVEDMLEQMGAHRIEQNKTILANEEQPKMQQDSKAPLPLEEIEKIQS